MTHPSSVKAGPFNPMQPQTTAAFVPFVLPQVVVTSARPFFRMGPGFEARVTFASASTDVTIVHSLGHPIQNVWLVSAPAGTYFPAICISSSSNANTNAQLIIRANAAAGACVVVGF